MKRPALSRRAQSTMEYAILIVIVIGALITMTQYMKRGIQGRAKSATDDIGGQYDPGNVNRIKWTNTISNTSQTFAGGVSNSSLRAPETTNVTEELNIANIQDTYWAGDGE
ncbi:MAG: hypothetical protein GX606_05175 [Elusimicrobia bacterium]|nr:hypothetical protein [Elusimicrobiota bacterium]